MQTSFLITARLKSTRLPKKILLKVKGQPLITHMINRIKYAKKINKIIICTSTNNQDDPLEFIAKKENINCYRGSENDVIQRLLDAANRFNLKYFANMTADIPMIDPLLIDLALEKYKKLKPDLLIPEKNSFGGCIVVSVTSLKKVCLSKNETDTEAWLRFFKKQGGFDIFNFKVTNENKNKFLKTSLDYYEDYIFIKKVFEKLYDSNQVFTNKNISQLLKEQPEIVNINSNRKHLKRWKDHIAKLRLKK